jgi:FtsP/CotA-like multicopper oxidase with cupredoxin domain
MMAHPFHIHDVQFQVLSVNGVEPSGVLKGMKDTVVVQPDQEVKIIMQFKDFSDSEIPYMFHCHILEHEDNGMMGQFFVV